MEGLMSEKTVDILMITYNRAPYTDLALSELISRSKDHARIWVWHNGLDEETLAVVRKYETDLFRFHHSKENVGLTDPTNWLFENAEGDFVSKVDDDCIVPKDWLPKLKAAFSEEENFGILGCWRFEEEDFLPEHANKKIQEFAGGISVLRNAWVEGSGYLMRRECVDRLGPIRQGETFTDYCINVTRQGWVNGWIYPFLYQEHMDDPRAKHTGLHSDEDLLRRLPLTASRNGVATLDGWTEHLRQSAEGVQRAPFAASYWSPWRRKFRNLVHRLTRLLGGGERLW